MQVSLDFILDRAQVEFKAPPRRRCEFPTQAKSEFRLISDLEKFPENKPCEINAGFEFNGKLYPKVIFTFSKERSIIKSVDNSLILITSECANETYNISTSEFHITTELFIQGTEIKIGVLRICRGYNNKFISTTRKTGSDKIRYFETIGHHITMILMNSPNLSDFHTSSPGMLNTARDTKLYQGDKKLKISCNKGKLIVQQFKGNVKVPLGTEHGSVIFERGPTISHKGGKFLDLSVFKISIGYCCDTCAHMTFKLIPIIHGIPTPSMFECRVPSMNCFNPDFTILDMCHIDLNPTKDFWKYFDLAPISESFGMIDLTFYLKPYRYPEKYKWRYTRLPSSPKIKDKEPTLIYPTTTLYPFTPLFVSILDTAPVVASEFHSGFSVYAVASDSCNITPFWLKYDGLDSEYGPKDLPWDEETHNLGEAVNQAYLNWRYMAGIFSSCYTRVRFSDGSTIMCELGKGSGKSGFYALDSVAHCGSGNNFSGGNFSNDAGRYAKQLLSIDPSGGEIMSSGCARGCGAFWANEDGVLGNGQIDPNLSSGSGSWLVRGASDYYSASLNFDGNMLRESCKAARGVWYTTNIDGSRNTRPNPTLVDAINNLDSNNKAKYYWQRWYLYPNVPAYLPSELLHDHHWTQDRSVTGQNPFNFKFTACNNFQLGDLNNSISIDDAVAGNSNSNITLGNICILDNFFDVVPPINTSFIRYEPSTNAELGRHHYYGEFVIHYKEDSIFTPPRNCDIEDDFSARERGGPYNFTNDVPSVIRCAAECVESGDNYIYTYSLYNFDFDRKISRIDIPYVSNEMMEISNVSFFQNRFDDENFNDTPLDCEWNYRYELRNSDRYIVFYSNGRGNDDEDVYDPSSVSGPPGAFSDKNLSPIAFGCIFSIKFTCSVPPKKHRMSMYNYMPISSSISAMNNLFSNPVTTFRNGAFAEKCSISDLPRPSSTATWPYLSNRYRFDMPMMAPTEYIHVTEPEIEPNREVINVNTEALVGVGTDYLSVKVPWGMKWCSLPEGSEKGSLIFTENNTGLIKIVGLDKASEPVILADCSNYLAGYGEGGLLGLTIHPDFPQMPYVFVSYNTNDSMNTDRLVYINDASGERLEGPYPQWGGDPPPPPVVDPTLEGIVIALDEGLATSTEILLAVQNLVSQSSIRQYTANEIQALQNRLIVIGDGVSSQYTESDGMLEGYNVFEVDENFWEGNVNHAGGNSTQFFSGNMYGKDMTNLFFSSTSHSYSFHSNYTYELGKPNAGVWKGFIPVSEISKLDTYVPSSSRTRGNAPVKPNRNYERSVVNELPGNLINTVPRGSIHNGSRLLIVRDNPDDMFDSQLLSDNYNNKYGPYSILISTGDVNTASLAPNENELQGKILRLGLDGSIPVNNPFGNEVWTKGHRNPQGLNKRTMVYDGETIERIYSTEHGQNLYDEANIIPHPMGGAGDGDGTNAWTITQEMWDKHYPPNGPYPKPGADYGWPKYEGNVIYNSLSLNDDHVPPLTTWTTPIAASNCLWTDETCSIPEWRNSLLVSGMGGFSASADFSDGNALDDYSKRLFVLKLTDDGLAVVSPTSPVPVDGAINPGNSNVPPYQMYDTTGSNASLVHTCLGTFGIGSKRIRDLCQDNSGNVYFAMGGTSYQNPGSYNEIWKIYG